MDCFVPRNDEVGQPLRLELVSAASHRHCEERSDVAVHGLLRSSQ
jgi:hypothetical protein